MIHTPLPILNPEIRTTKRMAKWLRSRATVRRMLRLELYQQDPHCGYCRRPLACPDAGVLDHATPKCRGGGDRPSNAILSCVLCDRAKGDRTISEWKAGLLAGLFSLGGEESAPPPNAQKGESKSKR